MSMTKGEYRVGINFNPSGDDKVGKVKRAAADLIDLIETIPVPEWPDDLTVEGDIRMDMWDNEVRRLRALAQTAVEEAAMWAVKAATKGPMA